MDGKLDLDRRRFLGAAGGVAAAGALAAFPSIAAAGGRGGGHDDDDHGRWKRWLPADRIGIQLFTVRDLLADNELDLPGTFEMLADAGYAEVEIGGTYDGRTAAEFKRAGRSSTASQPEGSHVPGGGTTLGAPTRQTIFDDAEALGLHYVGLASPPGGTPATHDGYKALAEEFNTWEAAAGARGLKFDSPDQAPDFTLYKGTNPRSPTPCSRRRTGASSCLELDIAWIEAGGQVPANEYLKDDPSSLPALPRQGHPLGSLTARVRRLPSVAQPNRTFWLTDVGKGDIDFAKIFSALDDPERHHYFVEHDDAPDDETPERHSTATAQPRRLGEHRRGRAASTSASCSSASAAAASAASPPSCEYARSASAAGVSPRRTPRGRPA